jgi:hypothetical protein
LRFLASGPAIFGGPIVVFVSNFQTSGAIASLAVGTFILAVVLKSKFVLPVGVLVASVVTAWQVTISADGINARGYRRGRECRAARFETISAAPPHHRRPPSGRNAALATGPGLLLLADVDYLAAHPMATAGTAMTAAKTPGSSGLPYGCWPT